LEFRTLFRLTRAAIPSFAVRLTSGATVLIAIATMLPIYSSIGLAQSPTAPAPAGDAKREGPPSIIGAGTFVSLEGRFTVSLPQQNHGLQRLSIATPFGLAKGDSYVWRMKEASFVIGYADAAQAVDDPDTAKQVFTSLREEVKKLAAANHGEVGAEKQIELDNHPGIEQRIELFTGLIVQRTYLVSHRLYQTVLVVNTTQRVYEAIAAGVLDTFKINTNQGHPQITPITHGCVDRATRITPLSVMRSVPSRRSVGSWLLITPLSEFQSISVVALPGSAARS
jgi:hypothetical protein